MSSRAVREQPGAAALVLLLSASLTLMSACGAHFVARGTDLYRDGRYVEAAEVFERTEARLTQASTDERARFGLYRGATFLRLGDTARAAQWLGYARSVVKSDPEALDEREVALLETSIRAVASAEPALPDAHPAAEVATAPAP